MDQEALNLSIRKFLKTVGVGSQREIEHAVREALERRTLAGDESFPVTVTLEIPAVNLKVPFDGDIKLK